jgi:hypothetical protein
MHKIAMVALLGGLTAGVQAQVLLGGFQGAGDPTDAGWSNPNGGASITTDTNCAFVSGAVPGYAQSLAISCAGHAGSFGYPSLKLSFSPSQVQAFNTNSWITFTFSVPTNNAGGYSQIYNLAFNASTYGYNNHSWSTAMETGVTNADSAGSGPGFGLFNNSPVQTQVVTVNYSDITNAIISGGEGFLQMTLQGNQGGGAPVTPAWYLNNVVLSTKPFGTSASATVYVVDDFSTNGVSPLNATNDDYFDNTNGESYISGSITNVYGNWFGGGFTSLNWSTNDTATNPASGSLQLNVNPAGGQWVLHHPDYSQNLLVNSLVYTDVEMDVMFDPSSASSISGGSTNYGPLRIGVRESGAFGQDWFYYPPVITNGNNGWVHIVAPLSATDANQQQWGELLLGMDPSINGWNGTGAQIIYVDNIVFKGPLVTVTIPPPTLSVQKAIPGLRLYASTPTATYDRSDLVTASASESWLQAQGSTYPVTYAFTLLSYPNNNINQTMLELIPVNSLNGNATYGQEFGDYQAGNGLWLVLAPNGGGAVVADVEWKTNYFNANPGLGTVGTTNYNPNYLALSLTNSTALGTWLLTFTGDAAGTLTPPGGTAHTFTIADPNIGTDFANPMIAQFGLQPNSTAGEGLYETWGFIGITNVSAGNQSEDFTTETSDFILSQTTGYYNTPGGNFSTANSANQATQISAIIARPNQDLYWVSWTTPAQSFTNLVTGTNLLLSPATHWVSPLYYSSGNDDLAPRGNPEPEGPIMVELIPADNAATVNGQPGGPIAPDAYFLLTTNPPAANP